MKELSLPLIYIPQPHPCWYLNVLTLPLSYVIDPFSLKACCLDGSGIAGLGVSIHVSRRPNTSVFFQFTYLIVIDSTVILCKSYILYLC